MPPRISGTVSKALDILDLFPDTGGGLTVMRIADATGIHKSTVTRLCATLEGRGYLRRDALGGYHIGRAIGKLAGLYGDHFRLEDALRPVLQRLRDRTGESASFYVIEGASRLCLFRENSRHQIRHVVDEGARLPLKKGVVGHVLLAFSGARGARYAQIRRDGHLDADGREPFTASVSVPVTTRGGALVGALVVSGLSSRFSPRKRQAALKALREDAAALRDALPERQA